MARKYFIGIDPGKSGGAALIDDSGEIFSVVKFSASEHDIATWFDMQDGRDPVSGRVVAVIEKVHSFPRNGVRSMFTFGQSYGFLRGMLVANQIPFNEVLPNTWMKYLGCQTKGDKKITYAKAQQLFPKQKITHHIADALLIAEYARRAAP